MYIDKKLWIAKSEEKIFILPKMANRHGLIAGATGTGKTITLKVMAESFSDLGVPVFLADIKSDLAGMCEPGADNEDMQKRIKRFGMEDCFAYKKYPTRFWDVFGEKGHAVRTTISEMGPMLLARLMSLNDTQSGILDIVFRVADDQKMLMLDIKDLKAMLQWVGEHAKELQTTYGNVSKQSVGTILRNVLTLEDQGGNIFFGEPALNIADWMRTDVDGRGFINVLDCVKLIQTPALYSTFLLWMLSELFETLPEAGDLEKPKMVFFFDEAHLLFNDAPKVLLEKVEQVVRLIRSKGVGIYFISQSPTDMPDTVLAQLGNRVQHALRAYYPAEHKAIKSAAQTFRPNPDFDTEEVITQLGTGEALVSFLDEEGRPSIVERAHILPPQSLMGGIDDAVRAKVIADSEMAAKYGQIIDRESAYEVLAKRCEAESAEKAAAEKAAEDAKQKEIADKAAEKARLAEEKAEAKEAAAKEKAELYRQTHHRKSSLEKAADSAMTSIGREVGRSLFRGLMGALKK
ncbi:MAG: helicase HerA-like domain-containing protein [Hydrogenoanaerobacterium sp.]